MKKHPNVEVSKRTGVQINLNATFLTADPDKLKKALKKAMVKIGNKHGIVKDKLFFGNISAEMVHHQNLLKVQAVVNSIEKIQNRDWRRTQWELDNLKRMAIANTHSSDPETNVITDHTDLANMARNSDQD